jgi:hypothetical protein
VQAWTEGRLKSLIFLALLVVALAILASLLYFGAGQRVPEGAQVVWGPTHRIEVTGLVWRP